MLFCKKPSLRPSTKHFLIFGHILVLKVSLKLLNLANELNCWESVCKSVNVAYHLSYDKQNASVRVKFYNNVTSTLFWYRLTLISVILVQCAICQQFLSSFLCSSKSFLNFRLSITGLLINWFLIRKTY